MAKVTMNLTDEELDLIKQLREQLHVSTNTGAVGQSLRIANLVAKGLKSGKKLAFLNEKGQPDSKIVIPGISESV